MMERVRSDDSPLAARPTHAGAFLRMPAQGMTQGQSEKERERRITSEGANIWLMWDALAPGSVPGNESNQAIEATQRN